MEITGNHSGSKRVSWPGQQTQALCPLSQEGKATWVTCAPEKPSCGLWPLSEAVISVSILPFQSQEALKKKNSLFQNVNLLKSVQVFFSPKLGLDIARTCRSGLYFFLLLFSQDPFSKQEVSGCDVVIPVGFQGSKENKVRANISHLDRFVFHKN